MIKVNVSENIYHASIQAVTNIEGDMARKKEEKAKR